MFGILERGGGGGAICEGGLNCGGGGAVCEGGLNCGGGWGGGTALGVWGLTPSDGGGGRGGDGARPLLFSNAADSNLAVMGSGGGGAGKLGGP